jgi:hypothetical protein
MGVKPLTVDQLNSAIPTSTVTDSGGLSWQKQERGEWTSEEGETVTAEELHKTYSPIQRDYVYYGVRRISLDETEPIMHIDEEE